MASSLDFCDTIIPGMVGERVWFLIIDSGRSLGFPLSLYRTGWGEGHSFFLNGFCLKVFCFASLPFSWSFGEREQVFVGAFRVLAFLVVGFFKSVIYEAKRKLRAITTVLFLES